VRVTAVGVDPQDVPAACHVGRRGGVIAVGVGRHLMAAGDRARRHRVVDLEGGGKPRARRAGGMRGRLRGRGVPGRGRGVPGRGGGGRGMPGRGVRGARGRRMRGGSDGRDGLRGGAGRGWGPEGADPVRDARGRLHSRLGQRADETRSRCFAKVEKGDTGRVLRGRDGLRGVRAEDRVGGGCRCVVRGPGACAGGGPDRAHSGCRDRGSDDRRNARMPAYQATGPVMQGRTGMSRYVSGGQDFNPWVRCALTWGRALGYHPGAAGRCDAP